MRRDDDGRVAGDDPLFAGASEIAARMRAVDWASTPLGPPAAWPQSLRTIVRVMLTSRYAMWMGWGPELRFFYNDAYRPTLGEKHAWALGAPARRVWAEIWPTIGPRIEHVLQRGEATYDEGLRLFLERRGYPEETYHTFSYSPLPSDDGSIAGMLCVVTEETERVIGARRLALLRELAAQLAASNASAEVFAAVEGSLAKDGHDLPFSLTYLFEDDGRRARLAARTGFAADHPAAPASIEVDDPAAPWPLARLRGSATAELVDLAPETAWPTGPWDGPPTRALALPIAQQGQARPAGVFLGGLSPHRPFDDAYGDFVGLFVGQVAAGLANARAYEEERRRAEALAEIDRAKTTFFSNVSHELRTPLTLMLGPLSELVAAERLEADDRRQLALVHRNGLRLLRLVNTLLDFSRIEAGRVEARYEPVDLAELTADLASAFRSATEKAGLRLVVDCPPLGEPAHVDRDMWEKIVLNLVSNAFKFTLRGEIRVRVEARGDRIALTVADTGAGIAAHELPRLFERFHRIEGAQGRTHEGTGIGLALVHELVKLHGGEIAVDSALGRGTAFTVTIPRGAEHLPQDRVVAPGLASAAPERARAVVEEALRWLPDATDAAADAPQTGGRVVLADDNADMRDYIRRLLGARWEVEAVGNGALALAAIRRRPPDLVVTDVMMPELDGFGLLAALRADERTRELPVLMLSARAGEEARLEGLQAGATEYLVKPFSARELGARVESLILQRRIRTVEVEQARRVADVFAQAPVAVALLRGPTHVYELANPVYREMIGGRDVVGKPIREALPELRDQGIYELLDGVYTTGERYIGRSLRAVLVRGPGGAPEESFFDLVYQPMRDASGEIDGIAVVAFDVTALAKARREADAANRAKDEFLAMLGHELRNPLAPILTALQLMRLRGSAGAEKEITIIDRQVRHLVGLVDDLLDVSRITRGKIALKRERMALASAVARAIEQASPLLDQHRHTLRVDVAPHGLDLDADPTRLAQVIANLLTNAAKYTRPGGTITVAAQVEGDAVALRVRDNGMGIDPEILPHIFEPFTQERQAIDRSQGGLGLGLAIVRSLVRLHGGEVSAASEGRGRGAEFTVRLPRPAGAAATIADPPAAATTTAAERRILVVDDNEDAAEVLAQALELSGYSVRVAHDGPSALRVAAEFGPDTAILDIGLPVMDGYELARRFAEDPRLRRTRLVAVTGYGQSQDRARSAAAGFADHLVKPVDFDALEAALARLGAPPPG